MEEDNIKKDIKNLIDKFSNETKDLDLDFFYEKKSENFLREDKAINYFDEDFRNNFFKNAKSSNENFILTQKGDFKNE